MGHKKRKTYLLKRNHVLEKIKGPLSQLNDKTLASYRWVLIPIMKTSATYIAVDAQIMSTLNFDRADIRFHMKLKNLSRENNANKNFMENVLWDYYTTTITATSYEELYTALYNIMEFRYVKELYGCSDSTDFFWFIDVVDLEVTFYKGRKKTGHFFVEGEKTADEVPFDYEVADAMAKEIIDYFGLGIVTEDGKHAMPNLYFRKVEDGMRWYERNGPVEIFSNISMVCAADYITKSYAICKADDYDQLARMKNASLYLTPIDLSYTDEFDPELLSIAAFYKLPKYNIGEWNGNEDTYAEPGTQVFHDLGSACIDVVNIEALDVNDIIHMIDSLGFILKVFHEGTAMHIVTNSETTAEKYDHLEDQDLFMPTKNYTKDPHLMSTVLANLVVELDCGRDSPQEDHQLIIYTDIFEDEMPKLKEVAYLLRLDDQPF